MKQNWFTLIELIVIITILVVMSIIWFVYYSNYLIWSRDSNRISQIKSILNWLNSIKLKWLLPIPDNKISITIWTWSNIEIISYQWYAWKSVLNSIKYQSDWIDPKDNTYFTYYLSKNRKYFQLLAFLEDKETKFVKNKFINKTYAVNYKLRFPIVYGNNMWVLTDENNIPVQDISLFQNSWAIDLWESHSWITFISRFNDNMW